MHFNRSLSLQGFYSEILKLTAEFKYVKDLNKKRTEKEISASQKEW